MKPIESFSDKRPLIKWTFLMLPVMVLFTWINAATIEKSSDETLAWIMSVLSTGMAWYFNKLDRKEPSAELKMAKLLLFSTGIIVIGTLAWNDLYFAYLKQVDFNRDIFRDSLRIRRLPHYTQVHKALPEPGQFWPIVTLTLLYFFAVAFNLSRLNKRWILFTAGYLFLALIAYSATDGWEERLISNNVHYLVFSIEQSRFGNIATVFSDYVSAMHDLRRSAHYPPGNILLFKIEELFFPYFAKIFVFGCTVFTIYPMYKLMRLMEVDIRTINYVILLYAFSTAIPSFPSFTLTAVTMPLSIIMVWQFYKFVNSGKLASLIYLGLTVVVFLLFTYSITIIGTLLLIMLIYYLVDKKLSLANAVKTAVVVTLLVSLVYWSVYGITGFNQIACFVNSVKNNTDSMSMGFDNIWRYFLRSFGNLIAYVGSVGIPVVVFGVYAMRMLHKKPDRRDQYILTSSLVLAIVISSFCGLFFLETARIWILFTPFLCIAAGFYLNDYVERKKHGLLALVLGITLAISVIEELLIDHAFGYFI